MRVLILHSRYLSGPASGENRVVEDEAELLRSGGHEVRLWDPSPSGDGATQAIHTAAAAVWSRKAAAGVKKLAANFRPDIVHCHNLWPSFSPSVLRSASASGIPTAMSLHNYRLMCLPGTFLLNGEICERCLGHLPLPGVRYKCYRNSRAASGTLATSLILHRAASSWDRVDRWFAVSAFLREKYVQAGFPADRIIVKANFAGAAPQRQGAGEYFLYVGRIAREKGIEVLLDAFSEIDEALVIIGDGPEVERLKSRSTPNVRWLGLLPGDEIPKHLARARALLVPSIWYEGAPRGILEAYSSGVPVLASKIGALPELVEEGKSGYLLPPQSPDSWRSGIARLVDPEVAISLGRYARQLWEEKYRPEKALSNLERAYSSAIEAFELRRH
jgi:glycosyltransferase involved in cell wall biosynthesis